MCETGLDWHHSTRDYVTAFGIYRPAWAENSTLRPETATPRQQLAVARRIAARFGLRAWGCYSHGGYLSWMSTP